MTEWSKNNTQTEQTFLHRTTSTFIINWSYVNKKKIICTQIKDLHFNTHHTIGNDSSKVTFVFQNALEVRGLIFTSAENNSSSFGYFKFLLKNQGYTIFSLLTHVWIFNCCRRFSSVKWQKNLHQYSTLRKEKLKASG